MRRLSFAFKSVFRRMDRYGFLVAMIAVGVGAVILVQAVTLGMRTNVTEGSARYLGGRFQAIARLEHGYASNRIEDPEALVRVLEKAGIHPSLVTQREIASENEPTLFFNGSSFRVRRVSGVDFDTEARIFDQLAFDEGGHEGLAGTKAILVSRQVAQRFGLRRGDEVTLRIKNQAGYIDSAQLVVGGVFRDASIFGYYNVYMDRKLLASLLGGASLKGCSTLGLYFDGRFSAPDMAARINLALGQGGYQLFSRLRSRGDLDSYWNETWTGTRYGVLPVENYIDDKIMDLITAIELVSYVFLAMTLLVILVGMRNTTQIMTRKRFRELGTIRALGMSQGGTLAMVLEETIVVASLGFLLGLGGAVLILEILQTLAFDWTDGFDIFLKRGHLSWGLSPLFLALNYLALAIMTAAGSLPAARRAASISPAAAIAAND